MNKNSNMTIFLKGILKENPVFVLILGTCPTLAVTSTVTGAFGMGIAALIVLVCSNVLVSLLRKVIPDSVRIPCYIVVIAGFVTIVQMFIKAYFPEIDGLLGVYLPLITVNCIILGRAEAFASKNRVIPSAFDGLGMGLGFTLGLTCIAIFRELLGAGTVFGLQVMPDAYEPLAIFVKAPGAFFVLAMLTALQNVFKAKSATNTPAQSQMACGGNCAKCSGSACAENHAKIEANKEAK